MVLQDHETQRRRLISTKWVISCCCVQSGISRVLSATHVVPVSASHLQAPVTALRRIESITVTGNVLEGVAPSPVAWACPSVPLQLVRLGEIVP